MLTVVVSLIYCIYQNNAVNSWQKYKFIGHAFGAIDGRAYTNSLETFNAAYERGMRVFEVDLQMTADGKVVLVHDWDTFFTYSEESIIPTEQTFLETPILGKYTPLSFEDVVTIMEEYPDIWIMTDSKYTEKEDI